MVPLLMGGWVFSQDIQGKGSGALADSIFHHLRSNLEIAQRKSDPYDIAQGHLQLGELYYGAGLYSQAVSQYNKGLQEIRGTRDTLYSRLNHNIGKVHLSRNSFQLAAQYLAEAAGAAESIGDVQGLANAIGLWGICYEKMGSYPKALEKQRKSLALFKELDDPSGMALANENIGSIYEDLENYDLAFSYFERAYSLIKGSGTIEEAVVLNNLGDVHRKTANLSMALTFTEKALRLAQKIGDGHQLKSAHKDMAKAYALQNNFLKAYEHLEKYQVHNEEWIAGQNSRQLNVLQALYDSNRKEARIHLLQEQHKVNAANQKLLWAALFFCIALLVALYFFLDRKRKAKQKLQEYQQRELKSELDKKAMEERNLQREIQLKATALSRYSLHLSQKNSVLMYVSNTLTKMGGRKNMDIDTKLKQLSQEINTNLQQEGEWQEFQSYFKEIHPNFMTGLSELSQNTLSSAELRLGMLLRLNLSSKEIATITRVTPDSVRVARYRLRKKLPIGPKADLLNFLREL